MCDRREISVVVNNINITVAVECNGVRRDWGQEVLRTENENEYYQLSSYSLMKYAPGPFYQDCVAIAARPPVKINQTIGGPINILARVR